MALLVDVHGSAPLGPGAMMLVDDATNIEGSITGGCVEGALVGEAQDILGGAAARISTFGFSDDLAGTVGLTCGGTVAVFLRSVDERQAPTLAAAVRGVQDRQAVAVATLLDGPDAGRCTARVGQEVVGNLGGALDGSVRGDLRGAVASGTSKIRWYGSDGSVLGDDLRVFVHSFLPPPKLIVCGAVDFSAAIAVLASELGYDVTICEPRTLFANSVRYSAAQVLAERPEAYIDRCDLTPRDAVLVFTHDRKFDEPAIRAALGTNVGYIGALGSRRTARDRERRLLEAGVSVDDLVRLESPCGLDIGASTPAETALSVMSEIIARRNGRNAAPLTSVDGAIRSRAPVGAS